MANSRKKILYLVTQSDNGGAQQYVYQLATHFSDTYTTLVASGEQANGGALAQRLQATAVTYHSLSHLKRAINPWHDLRALAQMIALIKAEQPDIIHLNSTKISILGSLAARLARSKAAIVYTVHGWVFHENLNWKQADYYRHLQPFARGIERLFARHKDALICLSQKDYDAAIHNHIAPQKKLHTIYNGRDPQPPLARNEARATLRIPNDAFVIGTISNHYPAKGLPYLLEAFALFASQTPHASAHLAIIGDGPERLALQKQARALAIEPQVHFCGSHANAARLLSAFDIYAIASTKEGLPFALIEAMHAGLPIAATKVGAIPEAITHQDSGLIVPPKNAADLAAAFLELHSNAAMRQALGNAARTTAQERFTSAAMLTKTKALYERILATK